MDDVVWMIIGVISLLLVIGAVASVYRSSVEDDKRQAAAQGVSAIADMCARVCRMPAETYLSTPASLPAGSVMWTRNDTICIAYGDDLSCRSCGCTIQDYTLDLNNSEARRLFRTHEYECFFRSAKPMVMNCSG